MVAGARPNVVKIGPLLPEFERAGIDADVAFTGSRVIEHPDDAGVSVSFYGVAMAAPRWFLDIGTGTDAVMTGRAMAAFEELFAEERPDAVLVVGDVNPTLAATISAVKAGLPVVHLEAGLRCGNLSIPEEINRTLISRVAAMHLTPTERALENLEDEGVEPERIHFVGNIMAESVSRHLDDIVRLDAAASHGLARREYVLGSFHRPENVADPERLTEIVAGLGQVGMPVLVADTDGFAGAVEDARIEMPANVRIVGAVPYLEMLALERDAATVVTDSAGVQEETCMMFTPCVTVRDFTEQIATVECGANTLVAAEREAIVTAVESALEGRRSWVTPKRWDTAVSDRVVRAIKRGVTPLS